MVQQIFLPLLETLPDLIILLIKIYVSIYIHITSISILPMGSWTLLKQPVRKTLVDNFWYVGESIGNKFTNKFTDR